jgi:hypothetical protein
MKLCANWQESSSVNGLEGNSKFQARNSKQVQKMQNPNVDGSVKSIKSGHCERSAATL